ncbi:pantoate--beta-alanine ligase [Pedobacter ginsengisoli]|uniref:pantoate--beta-alanine ligase n=1 Tax=Pedobacter ginsengisoli TaxID=363852 RepID=UPI00254B42FD|nr:pantoate--beta-alanine ligase [Pedobacter ginsengisoli]
MEVVNTITALRSLLGPIKLAKQKIALVPTMGALHKGHLSLIDLAKQQADFVVCSIFVNPTQFTDPKDLEKYPRPLEHDLDMLRTSGCDLVFMPPVKEMYPKPENWHIDLGPAEFLLEGEFRKGHYQGVTQIVKKLFDAVTPDLAFFGQKDFQQVLMIQKMVNYFSMPVRIITCPIIREEDGLAMSSRNIHLSAEDRQDALVLSKALYYVRDHFASLNIPELLQEARAMIQSTPGVELDYFTIADGATLMPVLDKGESNIVALVAARVGQTRLIDNMILS